MCVILGFLGFLLQHFDLFFLFTSYLLLTWSQQSFGLAPLKCFTLKLYNTSNYVVDYSSEKANSLSNPPSVFSRLLHQGLDLQDPKAS